MSWRISLVLVLACVPLSSPAVGMEGFLLESDPSLFFASSNSVLDGDLRVRQIPLDQILFPRNRIDSASLSDRPGGGAFLSQTRLPVYASVSSSFVDPWQEAPGYTGDTSISVPGALEAEWEAPIREGYDWGAAIGQTLLFATVGHVFRVATEEKTRRELVGPFFEDWFKSARALFDAGWTDGGRDFTNYVVHPLSGAVYGHIYRQNHPQDRDIRIALDKDYFGHLAKTTAFSFIASLAWEIGPYSEASIGNVGLHNEPGSQQMAWVDVVVTPLFGVWGVMIVEDLFERFVIRKVEAKTANRWIKALFRVPLTPTRSMANLMAIKRADYRPDRQ